MRDFERPPIAILSAHLADLPAEENAVRHAALLDTLKVRGFGRVKVVQGVFEGVSEDSVVVGGDNRELVRDIAKQFGQRSILFKNGLDEVELVTPDGEVLQRGEWLEVKPEVAQSQDHTRDGNRFYTVKWAA